MILNYAWIIWILSSLSFVRFYVFAAAYSPKLIAKPKRTKFNTPKIIFQITTKGQIPIVQETINRIHSVCRTIQYGKYEVWVITDASETFENARTITVPKSFSCNAVFKGRALQYGVEIRRQENLNTNDTYIFHLDDESLITNQTICSVLTFLEDNPTPISEGLIIYPLEKEGKIRITNLLDSLRPFCCFECVDFMTHGNPAYIHGSNLLVRSDFEEQVGWDSGKTIAEDTMFAVTAKKKFGSEVFGWHGGVIEERSPYTIKDFFKQRKRWFFGLFQNLQYLTFKGKVSSIIRVVLWSSGFLSGLASVLAIAIPQYFPRYLTVYFLTCSGLWLLSYQIGAFLNGKYLPRLKRFWFHFLTLILSPLLGIIESLTPIVSIFSRPKTFEVVKK